VVMDNIYRTPTSDVIDILPATQRQFFVVSIWKLCVLFCITFGLYSLVWFYQHWKLQKQYHKTNVIPVLRAIFSLFFTHALFANIQKGLTAQGITYAWNPQAMATIYVVL